MENWVSFCGKEVGNRIRVFEFISPPSYQPSHMSQKQHSNLCWPHCLQSGSLNIQLFEANEERYNIEKACQANKVIKLLELLPYFLRRNRSSKYLKRPWVAKPLMAIVLCHINQQIVLFSSCGDWGPARLPPHHSVLRYLIRLPPAFPSKPCPHFPLHCFLQVSFCLPFFLHHSDFEDNATLTWLLDSLLNVCPIYLQRLLRKVLLTAWLGVREAIKLSIWDFHRPSNSGICQSLAHQCQSFSTALLYIVGQVVHCFGISGASSFDCMIQVYRHFSKNFEGVSSLMSVSAPPSFVTGDPR